MAILASIKRALGFSPEDDPEDDELLDCGENGLTPLPQEESGSTSRLPEVDDNELPGQLFDGIIEVFNSTQPEFVRECLSLPDQRAYLLSHLNEALVERLHRLEDSVRERMRIQCEAERSALKDEIARFKDKQGSLEQKFNDSKNARLSAERQKRALSDRLHDLESQVATLEAEKEQYELENRSMLNKLRLAGLAGQQSADATKLLEETDSLRQECEGLKAECEGLKAEKATLSAEAEALRKENASLKDAVQQMKARQEMADAMINDLNSRASSSRKELEEANANLEMLNDIQEQLTQFEEVKKKKDAKIAQLQKSEKQLRQSLTDTGATIKSLNAKIGELQDTIAHNLYAQAESEKMLREEISALRNAVPESPEASDLESATQPDRRQRGRKRRNKSPEPHDPSAIEEIMEDSDWLVAPLPTSKGSPATDDDFGYKAPVRRTQADDDKQLLLW